MKFSFYDLSISQSSIGQECQNSKDSEMTKFVAMGDFGDMTKHVFRAFDVNDNDE
ncbi:MAG: hypothetical protein ABJ004_11645 [Cyclobacteriaceae bacterium]